MKRRDFLKVCLAGSATVAAGGMCGKASASGTFEGYPDGMGVLVDTTRCIGCRSCEAAWFESFRAAIPMPRYGVFPFAP